MSCKIRFIALLYGAFALMNCGYAADDLYIVVGSHSEVALLNSSTLQTTTVIETAGKYAEAPRNDDYDYYSFGLDSVSEAVIGYDEDNDLALWVHTKMDAFTRMCYPLLGRAKHPRSKDAEAHRKSHNVGIAHGWRDYNIDMIWYQGIVYDKRLKASAGVVYHGSIRDKFEAEYPFLARISDEKYVEPNIDDCVFIATNQSFECMGAEYSHNQMKSRFNKLGQAKDSMWGKEWILCGQSENISTYFYRPSDHSNPSISKSAVFIDNRLSDAQHYLEYTGGEIHTYTFDEAVAIWHWDLIPRSQVPDGPLVKQQTHPAGKEPHIVMPTDRYEFYLADSDSFTTATVDPMMRIVYANSSFAWFSKLIVYEPSGAERRSTGLYQLDFKDGKASKLRLVDSLPFGAAWIFKVPEKPDEQADQPSPDAP